MMMGYMEHFEELRKRIFYIVGYFIIFLCIGFIFTKDIYQYLSKDVGSILTVLGPSEILWIFFMIASLFGIVCTIPFAGFQLWLFVKPALEEKEQKITLLYIPLLFILFILGIAFGYFIIFPLLLHFLESVGEGLVSQTFTVEKYFSFMANVVIPFGVLFEIPVVILFLTSLEIVNPLLLSKARKYVYFLLIILGITLSPPDFISDLITTIPLIILYEISIQLSTFMYKRVERMEK